MLVLLPFCDLLYVYVHMYINVSLNNECLRTYSLREGVPLKQLSGHAGRVMLLNSIKYCTVTRKWCISR